MDRFPDLLQRHQVQTVIDVRPILASRYFPPFNRNNLNRTLCDNKIHYVFTGTLLGGRPNLLALYTLEGRAD